MVETKELIETYNTYVSKIPAGATYIANCLREDDLSNALEAIRNFSEGALWLSHANELMRQQGTVAELCIEKIQEFLLEVNEGLEKQDYVLVADMFEYEIAPFFEKVELAKGQVQ